MNDTNIPHASWICNILHGGMAAVQGMIQRTMTWKLEELDRILNDPTAPLEAHRVWSLLDDVSGSFVFDEAPCPARCETASDAR